MVFPRAARSSDAQMLRMCSADTLPLGTDSASCACLTRGLHNAFPLMC